MKIKTLLAFVLAVLLAGAAALAEIAPFEYTFAVPAASDLPREEAVVIADAYFASRSDRVRIDQEDVAQYEKAVNFIRIAGQGGPVYCWAVAYQDGQHMTTGYGFAGMVLVSSPDGRILAASSDPYWETFAGWEKALTGGKRSSADVWGAIDLIALPEGNRTGHVLPDLHSIREEEARQIANRLVAGYQRVAEADVEMDYDVTVSLQRDLIVSDHPIWRLQYMRWQDTGTEDRAAGRLQYTVALYAHTGGVWYVIDHLSGQVMETDHSGCRLPLAQDAFTPAEWQLSDYSLLFGAQ